MSGEIFYFASAAEVKALKGRPKGIWKYRREDRRFLDLEQTGHLIDLALCRLQDLKGDPALGIAVNGGADIGDNDVVIRHLAAGKVKEVARALSSITREEFSSALYAAGGGSELEEACLPRFQDLVEFYGDAAAGGKAVVKTIY